MKHLRVWDGKAIEGTIDELTDPATPADILALLREWGGEEVWWCEEHKLSELSGMLCATMWLPSGSRTPCRMTKHLLVRLDVLAADTGSTE